MKTHAPRPLTQVNGFASREERLAAPWPTPFADDLVEAAAGGETEQVALLELIKEIVTEKVRVDPGSERARQLATRQLEVEAKLARVNDCLHQLWRMHLVLSGAEHKAPIDAKAVAPDHPARRNSSKSELIRNRLASILQEQGPTHRADLLERLVTDGLLVRDKHAMNRLASILAGSKHLFGSLGGGVFTLRVDEPQQQQAWVEAAPLSEGPPGSSASNRQRKGGHNPCDAVTPAS